MRILTIIIRLFLVFFSMSVLPGCGKDTTQNGTQIPIVPTDILVNINLPGNAALANPGGFIYHPGGSMGLVIYRLGPSEFSAFDRHCPYRVNDQCQVEVINGVSLTDSLCCGSVFDIVSGLPTVGPAEVPLYMYQTSFNPNANTLRVFN